MDKKIVLSSELSMKINKIITQLRQKVYPDCILLTDISGQLLDSYARFKEIRVENLSALFASNMGATNEIATEISEDDGFEFNLHEGKHHNVFISKIASSFVLAIIFPTSEKVGVVRLFAKRASMELMQLIDEFETQVNVGLPKSLNKNFSGELSRQFMDLLEKNKKF